MHQKSGLTLLMMAALLNHGISGLYLIDQISPVQFFRSHQIMQILIIAMFPACIP